jgi:hypothetical protein
MEQVARLPTRKESALKPLYVMIRDIRQLDHGSTSEAAAALSNIDGYSDELSGRLYGDPEGHSEASHRGWEERGGSRSRYRDDDEDRRHARSRDDEGRFTSSRSRYDDDDDDRRSGRRHVGWYGDPEGHSEAARRGRR